MINNKNSGRISGYLICILIFISSVVLLSDMFEQSRKKSVFWEKVFTSGQWIETNYPGRYYWMELFGYINKALNKNVVVSKGNMYIQLDNGQLVYAVPQADVETAASNVAILKEYCDSLDIEFLYVNFPSKPVNDNELKDIGIATYTNKNADMLISNLKKYCVPVLDIRESMTQRDESLYFWFFKTDHHWRIEAGLFAAKEIINKLNEEFDFHLKTDVLDEKRFVYERYEQCWLGETGRQMSKAYSGLDDFVKIVPDYDTQMEYIVPEIEMNVRGDFSVLIDESRYNKETSLECIYDNSWYYSYLMSNYGYAVIKNKMNESEKKILLIKDSFSLAVAPFLALTTDEVIMWDLRYNRNSLKDYLDENDIDVVVIALTETSIIKSIMFEYE